MAMPTPERGGFGGFGGFGAGDGFGVLASGTGADGSDGDGSVGVAGCGAVSGAGAGVTAGAGWSGISGTGGLKSVSMLLMAIVSRHPTSGR